MTNSVEYGLRFALSKSACVKNSGMRPSGRAFTMASTEKKVRTSNHMVIIKHTQKIIKRNLVIVECKAGRKSEEKSLTLYRNPLSQILENLCFLIKLILVHIFFF